MTTTPVAPLADTDLLARVRAEHQAEVAAGGAKLVAVAAYAAGHRVAGIEDLAEGEVHADREVELAGPGAPGVSEFAVVELAAVLGVSARSAKNYVGDALELTHRLPAVWARVLSSDLPAWRARSITQRTKQLSAPAATWVDARVGPVAHKLGFMRVNQLIEQAITLFDAETEVEATLSETYVTITPAGGEGMGLSDLAQLEAVLRLDDALALEIAIAARARDLVPTHPDTCHDERRALALGSLATGEGHHDLALVVHLGEPALVGKHLARVRTSLGVERLVTTEAVATWCDRPGVKASIKPVLDLNQPLSSEGYAPSARLREQVTLLSPTCVFPHCPVPAERCDLDHIQPWQAGGATATINLAPLCRLHHRVKTFDNWTYTQLSPGTFDWTSPSGDRYQRDRDRTTDLSRVVNDETPHDRRAYEPGEPVPSAPAIRGAISRSALPRCEIASFSATDSSAEVRPSGVSAATKSGS